jgi:hypothetical protein
LRLISLGFIGLWCCAASAQVYPNIPANTVLGRLGSGNPGPPQALPFASLMRQLRNIISVRDFGAVCDGTTDDTGAFAAALVAATGGAVYIPKGRCLVGALTLPLQTKIYGDGPNASVLLAKANSEAILTLSNGTDLAGFNEISSIGFDGNGKSSVTGLSCSLVEYNNFHDIFFNNVATTFSMSQCSNFTIAHITSLGAGSLSVTAPAGFHVQQGYIGDYKSIPNAGPGSGAVGYGMNFVRATNMEIVNPIIYSTNGATCIAFQDDSQGNSVIGGQLTACASIGIATVTANGATPLGITINGTQIDQALGIPVVLRGAENKIVGANIYSTTVTTGNPTGAAIVIGPGATNTGPTIVNSNIIGTAVIGVELISGAVNVQASDNTFDSIIVGAGTAYPIKLDGSNSVLSINANHCTNSDGSTDLTYCDRLAATNLTVSAPAAHSVLVGEGASNVVGATIGTAGRLLVDQGAAADPSFNAMSQDCTMAGTGAITCTKTNNTSFSPLATATIAAIANGGTADNGSAWTPYSPSLTCGSGSFTTATATGRYKTLGKTVFVSLLITMTTNNTCASFLNATLPFMAGGPVGIPGRISNTVMGQGVNGSSAITIVAYDGTYPFGDGKVAAMSGVYESQ